MEFFGSNRRRFSRGTQEATEVRRLFSQAILYRSVCFWSSSLSTLWVLVDIFLTKRVSDRVGGAKHRVSPMSRERRAGGCKSRSGFYSREAPSVASFWSNAPTPGIWRGSTLWRHSTENLKKLETYAVDWCQGPLYSAVNPVQKIWHVISDSFFLVLRDYVTLF